MTIGPWAFLILYDILLYIWRAGTYEIPIIGGRARGRRRPVAPSFSERPSGRRRAFSLTGTEYDGTGNESWSGTGLGESGEESDASMNSEPALGNYIEDTLKRRKTFPVADVDGGQR